MRAGLTPDAARANIFAPGLAGAEAAAHAQRAHNNQYIGCNVFYLLFRKATYAKWISLPRCSLTLISVREVRGARRACTHTTHGASHTHDKAQDQGI